MKFKKAKCKLLHTVRAVPSTDAGACSQMHWAESSPAEEDLGVSVGEKLSATQPWALAARAPAVPGLPPQQGRQGEGGGSAPLPRSAETPPQRCLQLWDPA